MTLKNQTKWLDVIRRNQAHPVFANPATIVGRKTTWQALQNTVQGKPLIQQLNIINEFWNNYQYRQDSENYGQQDYWAAPYEFLKRSGDCEDYCIVKYFTLKALGFPVEKMRIVIVLETVRDIGHAILAVYADDDIYILDNLSDAVLSASRIRNYIPKYSVNEKFRWTHIRQK